MFEFKKLCNEVEKLRPAERGLLLAEKSVAVIKGLDGLDMPFDPLDALVAFIIGSVVSDGSIREKDYLYIYPALVKAFGHDCDLAYAKRRLQIAADIKKELMTQTKNLMSVIAASDEVLASDIVVLCLLVMSVDGKISLKEKHYIRQLCARMPR